MLQLYHMQDAKEEIKSRLAVEDVVGQYVELKRAGRNLKGHSPWGVDKTPSFMVSPEKGIWHDFSANKGGDIFTFVMEVEGISFKDALEKLAGQAGVDLTKYRGGDPAVSRKKARAKEALGLAAKYYQACLVRDKSVCEYVFYKRNLNRKTVEEFKIGYAPASGKALVEVLKKRGFTSNELDTAGLLNRFKSDLFRDRMIVPFIDTTGNVIGFTARIIEKDDNSPKYLNTPETLLYNKGRHIFGLSQAKDAIRRSEFVVVVEGNMDVISSHQAGVCEAVATAGTAMTEMHLKSFARMTNDIRLAYDGDEAGVKAAERAISMASKFGIFLSVIDDYHGCKDADELIQKDPALWQKATQSYRPALEWLLEKYEEKFNLRTEKGFAEYADEAKRLIDDVEDAVLREKYERLVSERLGISLEAFRAKKVAAPKKKLRKNVAVQGEKAEISRAEKNLAALLKYGDVKIEGFEPVEVDEAELSLIYDELYAKLNPVEREKEGQTLLAKVEQERMQAEREELAEAIAKAEEAEDDSKVDELMKQLQALDRKMRKK